LLLDFYVRSVLFFQPSDRHHSNTTTSITSVDLRSTANGLQVVPAAVGHCSYPRSRAFGSYQCVSSSESADCCQAPIFSLILPSDFPVRRAPTRRSVAPTLIKMPTLLKRTALEDISPSNKRTTEHIAAHAHVRFVSPQEEYQLDSSLYYSQTPHRFHSRHYLPGEIQKKMVRSLVDFRWRQNAGITLDKALFRVIDDEMNRGKSAGKKKDRDIQVDLLGDVIDALLKFLYSPRHQSTQIEALVDCIFNVTCVRNANDYLPEL
jgi:hypothetical protein